jgi:hypothetical protein
MRQSTLLNSTGQSWLLALVACLIPVALASPAVGQTNADKLIADKHYLRAEQEIRQMLQRAPNDAHALSDLSVVDRAFARWDAALANAERAVAIAGNSVEAHSKLADALGGKLLASDADSRVGTFAKIALAHRFRKEIDRTLELDPNDLDALQDLARFYWHAPGMVGGDKQKARQTADRLFHIAPDRGAIARADIASDEGDPVRRAAAIEAIWREAVAAQQQSYAARAALAAAYLDEAGLEGASAAGHLAAAETEAKRALALDPSQADAYRVLAAVCAMRARWNELDALLKQAYANVPDDRAPEFSAAVAILNGSVPAQLPRAEQMLRDYLAQPAEGRETSHASAQWRLGLVLEKEGRRAEAMREIQAAVQQDGSLEDAKRDLKRLS